MPYEASDLEVCVAVSSASTLGAILLRSPDVRDDRLALRTFEGYSSAARALNAGLEGSSARVVILPHQDVYLPAGFVDNLIAQLARLELVDPQWAVVGCIGIDDSWQVHGQTWSSGMQKLVGSPLADPARVTSVDEMILVVNMSSGVRFDEHLPGFHLYGTEVVVSAANRGLASYVVPMPVIHHSRRLVRLGRDYWGAYRYLRRLWRDRLPVPTLFGGIRRSFRHLAAIDLDYRVRNRFRSDRPEPAGDPQALASELGFER